MASLLKTEACLLSPAMQELVHTTLSGARARGCFGSQWSQTVGIRAKGRVLPSLLKLLFDRYAWITVSLNVTVTFFMWIWLLLTHLYFLFMSAMMSVIDSTVLISILKKIKF